MKSISQLFNDVQKGSEINITGFFGDWFEETRVGIVSRKIDDNNVYVKVYGKEYKASLALYKKDSGEYVVIATSAKSQSLNKR